LLLLPKSLCCCCQAVATAAKVSQSLTALWYNPCQSVASTRPFGYNNEPHLSCQTNVLHSSVLVIDSIHSGLLREDT
jgi:hypothetical protein